jgi:Kef-type K+ transport system membrane component KefB
MILLGSAFASHTLIAFPILTRLGVTRNEAVAVTTGATVLTDIGAFIVLAVVLGAKSGGLSLGYFLQLFVLLSIFTLLIGHRISVCNCCVVCGCTGRGAYWRA